VDVVAAERPRFDTARVCAEFLAQLSHEMRTPLNSILGVTQMLVEGELTEADKEFADTIAESAQALTAMADGIAEFARCLGLQKADLHALVSKLNQGGIGPDSRSAGTVAHPGNPSRRGVDDMLEKSPQRARGTSNAGNFITRVPPETAKLIRILVAEDHLMNQRVMLRMLERLGYTADAVSNGREAVSALTRSPYDIVLMDCQMPELDGYEATRVIRSSGGRFRSTPIIAVTANAMDGDREKCLASGMSDYMSKPVLAQTLASTLEKWILPDAAAGAVVSSTSPPAAVTLLADASASDPSGEVRGEAAAKPEELPDPIDMAAIDTLRSMDAGDEGFVAKIIDLFLGDLADRIKALRAAVGKRDGDALKRIAHALKGSCGHFGAARLAMLCRKLEEIAAEQPVGDASGALDELIAESDRVGSALRRIKDSAAAATTREEKV